MTKPATPCDDSEPLHLTEFGDFVALTAAILYEAGFSDDEIADVLNPANLPPVLSVNPDGSRVIFVQCRMCTARTPNNRARCNHCGARLYVNSPRHRP